MAWRAEAGRRSGGPTRSCLGLFRAGHGETEPHTGGRGGFGPRSPAVRGRRERRESRLARELAWRNRSETNQRRSEDSMRPGQNRRMRGRNNNRSKGPNPLTRSYESNGPDVKIRGTAQHIADKYAQLARDAQSSGDPVAAENYFQHAEHYYRMIAAAQEQLRQQYGTAQRPFDEESDEGDEEGAPNGFGYGDRQPGAQMDDTGEGYPQPYVNGGDRGPQPRYDRQDRGDRPDRGERQDRSQRFD